MPGGWARVTDVRRVVALVLALLVPGGAVAQSTPAESTAVVEVREGESRPRRPRTVPFVEGERVPEGYVLRKDTNGTLVAVGAGVFVLGYVVTLLFYAAATEGCGGGDGTCEDGLWPLWLPGFGPFIAIATDRAEGDLASFLVANGIVQSVGLFAVIYGLASQKLYWLRADLAGLRVTPLALGRGGSGLALSGRF